MQNNRSIKLLVKKLNYFCLSRLYLKDVGYRKEKKIKVNFLVKIFFFCSLATTENHYNLAIKKLRKILQQEKQLKDTFSVPTLVILILLQGKYMEK